MLGGMPHLASAGPRTFIQRASTYSRNVGTFFPLAPDSSAALLAFFMSSTSDLILRMRVCTEACLYPHSKFSWSRTVSSYVQKSGFGRGVPSSWSGVKVLKETQTVT